MLCRLTFCAQFALLCTACAAARKPDHPAVFDVLPQLQAALQHKLASMDVPTTPHPPLYDYGQPRNLTRTLAGSGYQPYYIVRWEYFNYGDYDMNGLVNAADLSPIAKYYGMRSGEPYWPEAKWVDG